MLRVDTFEVEKPIGSFSINLPTDAVITSLFPHPNGGLVICFQHSGECILAEKRLQLLAPGTGTTDQVELLIAFGPHHLYEVKTSIILPTG